MYKKYMLFKNKSSIIDNNFYHNLLNGIILADINNRNKECRIYYIDNEIVLCNKNDEIDRSFINGTNESLIESFELGFFKETIKFTDNCNKKVKDYNTKIYYNPHCMVVDVSRDTVQRYLIDSRILELDIDTQYDIISEKITAIMMRAQTELQKYLRRIKKDKKIAFGNLYRRMILSCIDPLDQDQYYYVPIGNKDKITVLIGNMNNLHKRYMLDNIVLAMLYVNTVIRVQIQEEDINYYTFFTNLGEFFGKIIEQKSHNSVFGFSKFKTDWYNFLKINIPKITGISNHKKDPNVKINKKISSGSELSGP